MNKEASSTEVVSAFTCCRCSNPKPPSWRRPRRSVTRRWAKCCTRRWAVKTGRTSFTTGLGFQRPVFENRFIQPASTHHRLRKAGVRNASLFFGGIIQTQPTHQASMSGWLSSLSELIFRALLFLTPTPTLPSPISVGPVRSSRAWFVTFNDPPGGPWMFWIWMRHQVKKHEETYFLGWSIKADRGKKHRPCVVFRAVETVDIRRPCVETPGSRRRKSNRLF